MNRKGSDIVWMKLASVLLTCSLAVGCASSSGRTAQAPPPKLNESHAKKSAITGALVGAVLGAIIGSKTGSAGRGAVIGAGIGAAVGYGVGKHQDRLLASRNQVLNEYGVVPEGKPFLKLEAVRITPAVVRPGGQVQVTATYVLVTPDERERPQIEYREGIRDLGGREWLWQAGPYESTLDQKGGGRFEMSVVLDVPQRAPAGSYQLGVGIGSGEVYVESYATLNVVG